MKLTDSQYKQCWDIFVSLQETALSLSHYQLAQMTDITDAIIWKEFLIDPRTADYVASEMQIIRSAAINEMVQKAPNSRSVGQSQLINALQKLDEAASHKEGPVFIYSYVPLNEQQKAAPNVRICDSQGIERTEDGTYIMEE